MAVTNDNNLGLYGSGEVVKSGINTSLAAAQASAEDALASEQAAAISETNAGASEANAAVSETNALASQLAAGVSETEAESAATLASGAASAANASEIASGLSETNAATSASEASSSAAAAAADVVTTGANATAAQLSADDALASQVAANASAVAAAGSEAGVAASAAAASAAASAASTSEGNAASSASAANSSAIDSAASAAQAQAVANNYDLDLLVDKTSPSGAAQLPTGTTAQRPLSPTEGMFRRNSETGSFEGHTGTDWAVVGGARGGAGNPFLYENDSTVTEDYTITEGKNAMSAGPITIPIKNLALWSEDFLNAVYGTVISLDIIPNQTDPFGGTDATVLRLNTAGHNLMRQNISSIVPSQTYTVSFWAKKLNGNELVYVDVGDSSRVPVETSLDWQRYSVTTVAGTGSWVDITYPGTAPVGSAFEIYGLQVEAGDRMTGYAKTTNQPAGATVTVPVGSNYTIV